MNSIVLILSLNLLQVSPQATFWKWFSENRARIATATATVDPKMMDEVEAALKKVHPGLGFEVGGKKNGKHEFFVTANFNEDVFPAVETLVAAAPLFDDFRIVAFKQPEERERLALEVAGRQLESGDVWFTPAKEPASGKVFVRLFVKNFRPDDKQLTQMLMLLLSSTVGEYAFMKVLEPVSIAPLPTKADAQGLQPLQRLRVLVDTEKKPTPQVTSPSQK